MQLNYDFVICVVTYYHNVHKSKKEMKSICKSLFFFLCLLLISISNLFLKVSSGTFHKESIYFAHSLFFIGFHFKFN